MSADDKTIEYLLTLDGEIMVINEKLGLWVKFEARQIKPTDERPHGIKYSLSLHDKYNHRIMGFDNAHEIEHSSKKKVAAKRTYYHWHKDHKDHVTPYKYANAATLIEDFRKEVERIELELEGTNK